jgi:hypothetical protein
MDIYAYVLFICINTFVDAYTHYMRMYTCLYGSMKLIRSSKHVQKRNRAPDAQHCYYHEYYYYCYYFVLRLLFVFFKLFIQMLKHTLVFVCRCFLLLYNISQIATGVPYSESPRKNVQIALILIEIGRDLICFGPVQSFDLLGWGSHVLRVH